jgi:hypothetical protein
MKISGPGQIQSSSVKKSAKKQASGGSSFSSELSGPDRAGSTSGAGGAAPLAPLESLLAFQEVPDSTDGRSKGLARAEDMLDLLEEVRRGILLGTISAPSLRNLADLARNHRQNGDASQKSDPRLDEILSDIELRSEVELAKLGL